MARHTIGVALASLLLLATTATAHAQDNGAAQKIDPTAPLGTPVVVDPVKEIETEGKVVVGLVEAAAGSAAQAIAKRLHLEGPFGGEPAPEPVAQPTVSAPVTAASPALAADVHFDRTARADASGAFFRKVISGRSGDYKGIETAVTLPLVHGFDPKAKPSVAPSVYVGGNGGSELDIGLSWDVVRDAQGQVVKDVRGEPTYAFRPFARFGKTWWNNSPNAATNKGDWVSNSKQYFEPGEPVRMSVQVIGKGKVQLKIQSARDPSKSFDRVFSDVPSFDVGHPTEWKRVHSIDEKGREAGAVAPTSTRLTGGHWDEVRLLLTSGGSAPMTGSHFEDDPGSDFRVHGETNEDLYNSVFRPETATGPSWGWTQDGGEAIQVEPAQYFKNGVPERDAHDQPAKKK